MDIQWYPGHMAKTMGMLRQNISLVDVVIEVLDARVAFSSKNPDIDPLARDKKRIVLLNKSDLADEGVTRRWKEYYEALGFGAVTADGGRTKGVKEVISLSRSLMEEKIRRQKERGRIFVPIRAMVCGIPNSGKSTFINSFAGRQAAKTADKPGVTRGKQWIKAAGDFELLDTPGILWPKFDDPVAGLRLAFTGAVNDNILDTESLCGLLIEELLKAAPGALGSRYGVEETGPGLAIMAQAGRNRGFLLQGGEVDLRRTAVAIIDEFRGGRLGRISLEKPEV